MAMQGTQAMQTEGNAPAAEKPDVPAALGAQVSSKKENLIGSSSEVHSGIKMDSPVGGII